MSTASSVYVGSHALVCVVCTGLTDCAPICTGVGDDSVCGVLIPTAETIEIVNTSNNVSD